MIEFDPAAMSLAYEGAEGMPASSKARSTAGGSIRAPRQAAWWGRMPCSSFEDRCGYSSSFSSADCRPGWTAAGQFLYTLSMVDVATG
jgi:hypothetical protein